jgi:acetylornithine deacetylase/succinyl-diaminopimelate desuccinylase-like protein
MPCAGIGVGHARSNIHAPNESIALEDFATGIHQVSHLFAILGKV